MSIENITLTNNQCQSYLIKQTKGIDSNKSFLDILNSNEKVNDPWKNILNEINKESNPIDREEDLRLYNKLKDKIKIDSNFNLEKVKNMVISFPPATAPGYIRKAYRELYEKSTPEQQKSFMDLCLCFESYKEYGKSYNCTSFLNSLKGFSEYFKGYENYLGKSKFDFLNKILNDFTNTVS